MTLKSLFNIQSSPQQVAMSIAPNADAKKTGETYAEYGERLSARVNANNYVLGPTLQSVYLSIKKEQQTNNQLQQQLRQKQQVEINNTIADKQKAENDLSAIENKIENINKSIEDNERIIEGLKIKGKERNRLSWLHLIISGSLLVPFTIYSFIFYSSVAYSAFFHYIDTNNIGDNLLSQAIFDSNAIPKALQDGFMEAMFILFMPVIFLALGYILHRFEQQKGTVKYIKIVLIILVAFFFDALLAFGVSKKIYDTEIMTRLGDVEPYTFSLAFSEPNFWTIICLGFVSYLLWGITFGFFMNALESLDINRIEIENLQKKIDLYKSEWEEKQNKQKDLKNRIVELDTKAHNLQLEMVNSVLYDKISIKLELNNFIKGWQSYMGFAGKSDTDNNKAKEIFDKFIAALDANSSVTSVAPSAA